MPSSFSQPKPFAEGRTLKIHFLVCALLFFGVAARTWGQVSYTYDNLGNRTTRSSAGGCSTPNAPNVSPSAVSVAAGGTTQLTASNCSGTVTWSNGSTNNPLSVTPAQTTTYTATCSVNGCTSSNSNAAVVTVNPGGGGSSCVVNKVRLVFRPDCCAERLNGAKIQGSNDGNNWTDLFNINQNGTGNWQEFTFGNSTAYSSVRFVAGPQGYGELVELEFYNGSNKLNGTTFSTGGTYASAQYGIQFAFDGNSTGNFWHSNTQGSSATAGLTLTNCGGDNPPGGGTCANTGSINYQRWENIGPGSSIQDLRSNTNNLQNTPNFAQNLTLFEAPTNVMDNYGVRILGYICPPQSGNYTFWVAGDDNSELWISPNDQPNNLSRIAFHNSWTPPREWNVHSTQQSASINLQAGQRYYVEALMKEGGGGDNLAVGWQLPNGALERPIPGNRLIPFSTGGGGGPACNFSTSATVNNANVGCGGGITLNAPCSGPDCSGVSYVWSGNGLYQTNQSVNTNAPNANGSYTYYVQASKTGCTTQNNSVAVSVSGCGGGGGGSSTCSAENEQCSGNSSEVRNYSVSASAGGSYTIKAFYRSHEGPGVIRWSVNGGAVQTMNVAQTSINNYVEVTLGTATLNAGNNTINLSSGGGFMCFRKACIEGGGGGGPACNFSTSATVNNANVGCGGGITLNAPCSGPDCGGVSYVWSGNGLNQTNQSTTTNAPSTNGSYTYYVQATKTGCSTQNNSVAVSVSGCGGGGSSCVVNKVRLVFRPDCCAERLNGAKIQGSNDGNNWTDLFNINQNATGNWQEFTFGNSTAYSLVRFVAGPQGYGELVELEFYNGSNKLNGTAFSTGGTYAPAQYGIQFAFDGNSTGNFWHSNTQGSSATLGLTLTNCGAPGGGGDCGAGNFSGSFDVANCNTFSGWALDQNNFGRTVELDILVDGTKVATIPANQSRPDLVGAFGNNPQAEFHGWNYVIPADASWRNGQNRSVVARPCGTNSDLGGSPKTVNCTGGGGGGGGGSSCVVNKVRLVFRPDCCAERLNGAKIQGSNDGNNWTDLFNINQNATGNWQEFTFGNSTAYSSVRFVAGPQGYGELVELEFYNGSNKLNGTAFSTGGTYAPAQYGIQFAFDGNSTGNFWHSNTEGSSATLGLMLSCGGGRVGIAENLEEPSDIMVYPNPTNGELTLQLFLENRSDVQITLHDLTGRSLWQSTLPKREGNVQEKLWLGEVSVGFYLLTVQTNERSWTQKIVLQK